MTDDYAERENESVPRHFESLAATLHQWFDKPLAGLPAQLRARVERDFFPMPWDELAPEQRRSMARQWDYLHDPANAELRKYWREFFRRKDDIQRQIEQWKAVKTETASDLSTKEARLEQLQRDLDALEIERQRAPGHAESQPDSDELASDCRETCPPVRAADIKRRFRVCPDEDQNNAWWSGKMRNAKRCGLDSARVGEGKKGPGPNGTLWRPDLVAVWLTTHDRKRNSWMNPSRARNALLKFAGCEELADQLFPEME